MLPTFEPRPPIKAALRGDSHPLPYMYPNAMEITTGKVPYAASSSRAPSERKEKKKVNEKGSMARGPGGGPRSEGQDRGAGMSGGGYFYNACLEEFGGSSRNGLWA